MRVQGDDSLINRAYNVDCAACLGGRLHTKTEWQTYHPQAGRGFDAGNGAPRPPAEPVSVPVAPEAAAPPAGEQPGLKLISIEETGFAQLAAWAYQAVTYILTLEKRLDIRR